MSNTADDNVKRGELEHYLVLVERELKEREGRCLEIGQKVEDVKRRLELVSRERALRRGDSLALILQEGERQALRQEVEKLFDRLREAQEDLNRARNRRLEVLTDLGSLEAEGEILDEEGSDE